MAICDVDTPGVWNHFYRNNGFAFEDSPAMSVEPGPKREYDRALEIFGGYGRNQPTLQKRHNFVACVDFSKEAGRISKLYNKSARFVCADINMLPFQAGVFDVVYCIMPAKLLIRYFSLTPMLFQVLDTLSRPHGILIVYAYVPEKSQTCKADRTFAQMEEILLTVFPYVNYSHVEPTIMLATASCSPRHLGSEI